MCLVGPGGVRVTVHRLVQRQLGSDEHGHGARGQDPYDLSLQCQDLRGGIRLSSQPDEPGQGGERGALLVLQLLPHRHVQQAASSAAHGLGGSGGSGGSGGAVRAAGHIQQFPQRFAGLEVTLPRCPVCACGARHVLQAARHPLDPGGPEHHVQRR
ncbi:hypothetical protein [Streptomyces tuirus]